MGAPLTEFYLEFVLRDALQQLRQDPTTIRSLFGNFTDDFLSQTHGMNAIKDVTTYIQNKEFHIVQGWPNQETKMPCCSINLSSSVENTAKDFFEDYAGFEEEEVDATVIVSPFTTITYSSSTGYVTIPNTINIDNVFAGHIFVDAIGEEFTIISIINESTNKKLGFENDSDITIGAGCYVKGSLTTINYDSKAIALTESLVLGLHAKDNPSECRYWYYVIMYLLASSRLTFERKGLQIHSASATDFNRMLDFMPEGVFTRFINLTFLTWLSWKGPAQQGADSQYNAIRVDKDVVAIPPESLKSIITTE